MKQVYNFYGDAKTGKTTLVDVLISGKDRNYSSYLPVMCELYDDVLICDNYSEFDDTNSEWIDILKNGIKSKFTNVKNDVNTVIIVSYDKLRDCKIDALKKEIPDVLIAQCEFKRGE